MALSDSSGQHRDPKKVLVVIRGKLYRHKGGRGALKSPDDIIMDFIEHGDVFLYLETIPASKHVSIKVILRDTVGELRFSGPPNESVWFEELTDDNG